jgi:hypothetical protein
MSRRGTPGLAVLTAVLAVAATAAAGDMSDPYEILNAHYAAVGGLQALRAEESVHFIADISTSGLTGILEHWELRPNRSREDLDLGILRLTAGDNGATAWALDTNGRLQTERDPDALARREVERRLALFEHLDPESDVFTITLRGTRDIDGDLCYVISVTSELDNATRLWFISTTDFLMKRSEVNHADEQQHIVYSDYREVNGVLHAFGQCAVSD